MRRVLSLSAAIALAVIAVAPAHAGEDARGKVAAGRPARRSGVNLQTLELRPTLPKADGPRKAVKLDYMMSDDQVIWDGAVKTLDAFKKLGKLSPTAHSLVFLDDPAHGAALWLLGDDPASVVSKSALAPGIREVPANSLLLMTKILRWVFANYPGEQRYLQIDSHGGGVFGIGSDEGQNPYQRLSMKLLPIQGFARALRDGGSGKPFDLVFFNACMMANVEALYEIAPSVRYAVGSELPIGGYDQTVVQDMPLLFERLVREGQAPDRIARALAQQAMKPTSTGVVTAVAMNLGKLGPIVAQIARFTEALLAVAPANRDAIQRALRKARTTDYNMGDLWTFARLVTVNLTDAAVHAEAKALFRLEAEATLFEKTRLDASTGKPRNWGGLSIYMPTRQDAFLKHGYAQTRFARETGWNRLLETLFTSPAAPATTAAVRQPQ